MHIHILGIGGTFMAGMARLAVAQGHRVSGSDQALYPPMSTQLESLGVEVSEGYAASCLEPRPDLVVVGNAMSRGNPAVEAVLDRAIPYMSGPEWLEREVLPGRHVLAIAGTHGKTTVSSLVTWMLEHAGLTPGFLVGGVLENFGISARLGSGPYFVIEADEYDTAFFDKRSKFVHYHPRTLVINNLEFDHADIFADLDAIQRQFHHLIRMLPGSACIISPQPAPAIDTVLDLGCWSRVTRFGKTTDCDWRFQWTDGPHPSLEVAAPGTDAVRATTPLLGEHNAWNVTAALSAVADVGVQPDTALASLATFTSVRRRLELRGQRGGISVYDDFAHHPTAITATLAALRGHIGPARIIAVLEPRSNTMRLGVHKQELRASLALADMAAVLVPQELDWDLAEVMADDPSIHCFSDTKSVIEYVIENARSGDHVLVMSNGGFDNIHQRLLDRLSAAG